MQGFKKIDPDRWEFANSNFQRDRPDLMSSIQRRKGQTKEQPSSNALIASGQNVIEVSDTVSLRSVCNILHSNSVCT